MKKEVCLMCIVCFFLGYFVADVVSKCGFGREHLASTGGGLMNLALDKENTLASKNRRLGRGGWDIAEDTRRHGGAGDGGHW
jgi:hypothetical protein